MPPYYLREVFGYIQAFLYNRAANQNQPNAEYKLYQLYNEGLSVSKNPIAAKNYYERAKAHGLQE